MKKQLNKILISSFIIIFYNLLIFLIPYPNKFSTIFWLSWGMGLLALITFPFIDYYLNKNDITLKKKIYKIPLIKINFILVTSQVFISILFIILNAFFDIQLWVFIIVDSLIIIILISLLLSGNKYIETINEIEEKEKEDTKFINNIQIEIHNLLNTNKKEELKIILEKLNDKVKYSDPISSSYSFDIEEEIKKSLYNLNINEKELEILINDIENIILLLDRRNEMVKKYKGY